MIESTVMPFSPIVSKTTLAAVLLFATIVVSGHAYAEAATEIQLSYKDKIFDPPEISAPPTRRS